MSFVRPRCAMLFAAFTLSLLMVLSVGGCRKRITAPTNSEDSNDPYSSQSKDPVPSSARSAEVHFPRRLLLIHISNYSSLPPLTTNDPNTTDQDKAIALRLAQELKVATQKDPQLFLLSDTAGGADNRTPTRAAVVDAYERFFSTSHDQDRIVVYFGGHAIEVEGKAYLAPAEGDRYDPRTLISVQDFYAKLKMCKATQRVVIWDVCRLNPGREREQRGSAPMTPSLSKALSTAPEGVEVVITCQPGEHALEFSNLQIEFATSRYNGSAFLESAKYVAEKNRAAGQNQSPADPIPVAAWISTVGKRVTEMAAYSDGKLKQTVRYYSGLQKGSTMPEPAELVAQSKGMLAEINAIVEEFRVPPVKSNRPAIALNEYPYPDDVIAAYKADVSIAEIRKNKQKYEFCNVTLNAFETLRDVWGAKPKGGLKQRDHVMAPISNELKKEVNAELGTWAIGIEKLVEVDRALEAVSTQKKNQPRRWQAHYDYARAVVKSRLAFMNEYDKLMGEVRTETLPELDKKLNQNAYRLVSSEKMKSKKDVQAIAEASQEAFNIVIAEHKDTPWAIQAKYEKSFNLGMSWQPTHRDK